jgi:hypothetical protein
VSGKLDDAELAVLAESAQPEARLLERGSILGIDGVAASKILDGRGDAIERGGPGAGDDEDALLCTGQRAGQRRDDEPLGVGTAFGMFSILEPEDVTRELDDRVLEATSGGHQGHAPFPGQSNRGQGAHHAAIRTARRDEEAGVLCQARLRALGQDLYCGDPLGVEADVSERLSGGRVSWSPGIEISDDPHPTASRRAHGGCR